MAVKIFFCYAHEDEALLKKLKTHLKPLQRQGLINMWHDRDISAGVEWEREISEHLNAAQMILLLVSPDFMDSDYCYSIEMKRAVERHEQGEARVIPIILRHVYWQGDPLGKLQALPIDARPVKSWQDQDEALYNVVGGIRKVVEEISMLPFSRESQQIKEGPSDRTNTSKHKFRNPLSLLHRWVGEQRSLEEATRRATIEAQQIAEMEAAPHAKAVQPQYEQPAQQGPVLMPVQPAVPQLPCPRCGELVPREANYCSHCLLLLSPLESGLHLRSQEVSRSAVSARSLANQSTMLQPYTKRQVGGTRFELLVGTRSDPGIKRKYKPNEDSLFAAQGLIDEASAIHPYGLFVIAGGIEGHANGQDASRLAIQTIIEHILPRLLKNANEDYAKLLVESIHSANLAVHHGDNSDWSTSCG